MTQLERDLICDEFPVSFYLGVHRPNWLALALDVPLFISHRVLAGRTTLPRRAASCDRGNYALDSGAFTELSMFGEFVTSPREYVAAVARYDAEIGPLDWAAPQDWMCEPFMLERTGLSVAEHLRRTVGNFVELVALWPEYSDHPECPIMPVIQGWAVPDYVACVGMYEDAGVRLAQDYPTVGVGSVCRRSGTDEIADVFRTLAALDLPLHGFGVKTSGLARYGRWLTSADSMAWSFGARRNPPAPGCVGKRLNCANCLHAALSWRDRVLQAIATGEDAPEQLDLWSAA